MISRPDLTGVLMEAKPGRKYQFFGYVRVAGIDYKLFAYPSKRTEGDHRWSLALGLAPKGSE